MLSGVSQAELLIKDAVVRLLPPGVPNTAAYFSIENRSSQTQVLIAASSDIVEKAEIHQHVMVNDVMRMQQQSQVEIAPGETIHFAPGGLHIMLFALKRPLNEGQQVSLSLHTLDKQTIPFKAKVARPLAHSHH
jgi:copper(I)-binding protein